MVNLEKKLQDLLPEIEQRRNWCFFPERCYESSREEGNVHSFWYAFQTEVFRNGVELSENRGVVRLTYLLDHRISKLGKDSKKVIQETFQDLDPDLRLVACWTGIQASVDYLNRDYLSVYLQYSPVRG